MELFRADNPYDPVVHPDLSGHGEGYKYLDSTIADGLGEFNIEINVPAGAIITSTATDLGNNTSEFSGNKGVGICDFGDAPDSPYPSLLASNGARHADWNYEWLGEDVNGELDSNQVDLDEFDDGVTFYPPYKKKVCRIKWMS